MIVKEFYMTREDSVNLYRTYSDEGFYILQNETSVKYSEAVDVDGAPFTYTETDEPIEIMGEATEIDYRDALEELGGKFQ